MEVKGESMSEHVAEPRPETDEAEVSHEDEGWATPDEATIETFEGDDDDAIDVSEATVTPSVPTQVANPGKATARTGLAVVIGTIITIVGVAPSVIQAIAGVEGLPEWVYPSLGAIGASAIVLSTILTRLMAIPAINDLLKKVGFGTGAE